MRTRLLTQSYSVMVSLGLGLLTLSSFVGCGSSQQASPATPRAQAQKAQTNCSQELVLTYSQIFSTNENSRRAACERLATMTVPSTCSSEQNGTTTEFKLADAKDKCSKSSAPIEPEPTAPAPPNLPKPTAPKVTLENACPVTFNDDLLGVNSTLLAVEMADREERPGLVEQAKSACARMEGLYPKTCNYQSGKEIISYSFDRVLRNRCENLGRSQRPATDNTPAGPNGGVRADEMRPSRLEFVVLDASELETVAQGGSELMIEGGHSVGYERLSSRQMARCLIDKVAGSETFQNGHRVQVQSILSKSFPAGPEIAFMLSGTNGAAIAMVSCAKTDPRAWRLGDLKAVFGTLAQITYRQ